jgi:hypothetical protein
MTTFITPTISKKQPVTWFVKLYKMRAKIMQDEKKSFANMGHISGPIWARQCSLL